MTLTGFERIRLFQTLPSEIGSLEESLKVKALRNRLIDDEFKDEIGWQSVRGQVNFDPDALESVEPKEFSFDEKERRLIAFGFLHDEQDGDVPTDDVYTDLLESFIDVIREVKDEDT